jgi:indole-3-glycerol phosphate synthase
VLLIVAAIDDETLDRLARRARALGLDVLVEVHDETELDRAIAAAADIIGVNNRDLRTLVVDVDASMRLAGRMPSGAIAVAESGLRTGADVRRLQAAGYRAFLIGERFMTEADPGAALAGLLAEAASC